MNEQISAFHFLNMTEHTLFDYASLTLRVCNASLYTGELAKLCNADEKSNWEAGVDTLGYGEDK